MPTLAELAKSLNAELITITPEAAETQVTRCARIDEAAADEVTFIANQKYASKLDVTDAAAVIVAPGVTSDKTNLIVSDDPYFAFRNAVVHLHGYREHPIIDPDNSVSEQAVIADTAVIGEGCVIHPLAVICEDAVIGDRTVIYPHTFVGPRAKVGNDCQLYPNVTIYDDCVLGDRVTLHAGCVIGQDGFGYATHGGAHHKIPQIGNAVLEDDVEMGAGCTIDRATMGSTTIGQGTKFSDLVAIGHGASIGPHNLLVAQVGIAGSAKTGAYVVMGGQVGVAGHLEIGDMVQLAAMTGVMTDLPGNAKYGGQPARPLNDAKRQVLAATRGHETIKRVKALERALEKLKKQLNAESE